MKLLHAADLHLDSPFSGLSPDQAALRRREQRMLLTALSEECRKRGCDLLLLAGDLFDGKHVYRDTLDALCAALADCGAEVLIAPGNHDCCDGESPYRSVHWPENVHIFKEQTISAVDFPALGCRVYGAGFNAEHCGSLLEGFRAADDGLINLMVLHGDASGASDYNPVTPEQLAASGLRYLALGHVHKGGQRRVGDTLAAWPGCIMGRGFDEPGEKGVYAVELTGGECRIEFVPMHARRYELLEVPAGDDPLQSILTALPEDTSRDVYRIILTGEAPAPDLAALHEALAPRFFALELRDRTQPPLELWQAADEDTLKGQFLTRMRQRYADAPEAERETVLLALRCGLALLEGREVPRL